MDGKKLPELSIFFPFWNEGENIESVVTAAEKIAPTVADIWEIIMVDDGSSDDTLQKAEKLAKRNKKLKVIALTPNRGYGAALKAGLMSASYKYVVFTDGDRQFDFAEVTKFIERIGSNDFVIGYRKKRVDNFFRHILMNLLKIWDYMLFGFHFKDIDCGFKMFRREAIEQLMPLRSEGAMITTEVLAKAKRKHLRVAQVEVNHYPRQHGAQSGGNIFVIVRAVLESLILWLDIKNERF